MINKVVLIGRLGRDPETRSLEGGSMVGRFPLATSESYKDKSGQWIEQTEWHNIVVWRELALRAGQQLRKGMLVYVEGKITYRSWRESDGRERYTTEIVASAVRMLGRSELGGQPQQQQPTVNHHQQNGSVNSQQPALQQPFYQPPKFNQVSTQPATPTVLPSSNNNSSSSKQTTAKTSNSKKNSSAPPAVQPEPKETTALVPLTSASKEKQPKKPKTTQQPPVPALPPHTTSIDDIPIIDDTDDYRSPRMTPEEEKAWRQHMAKHQFRDAITKLDEELKDEMPLERLSDLLAHDDETPF